MTAPQVSSPTVPTPYSAVDPTSIPTGEQVICPYVLCVRSDLYEPVFGLAIDDTTSDPKTLDVLSNLVRFIGAQTIVEVGTYRGWGTAVLAETIRIYGLPGHVWSCDPTDYGVQEIVDAAGLSDRVTLVRGDFEALLAELPGPMDFCYIDASSAQEAGLRLRYTKLALAHMNPRGLVAIDDVTGEWKGSKTLRRMANLYLPHLRGLALIAT